MIRQAIRLSGIAILAVLPLPALGAVPSARACALDGVPSISANGMLARVNTAQPAVADLARWAPFVFTVPVKAGAAVRLAEDRRALLKALPPQAFGRPWRWAFGDGTRASGFAPIHRYARPGTYIINVWAFDTSNRLWYRFDLAQIRVR
jgi:PKD domain-containing protein